MNRNWFKETSSLELHWWRWLVAVRNLWKISWQRRWRGNQRCESWSPSITLTKKLIQTVLMVSPRSPHGLLACVHRAGNLPFFRIHDVIYKIMKVIGMNKPRKARIRHTNLFEIFEINWFDCHMRKTAKITWIDYDWIWLGVPTPWCTLRNWWHLLICWIRSQETFKNFCWAMAETCQ